MSADVSSRKAVSGYCCQQVLASRKTFSAHAATWRKVDPANEPFPPAWQKKQRASDWLKIGNVLRASRTTGLYSIRSRVPATCRRKGFKFGSNVLQPPQGLSSRLNLETCAALRICGELRPTFHKNTVVTTPHTQQKKLAASHSVLVHHPPPSCKPKPRYSRADLRKT